MTGYDPLTATPTVPKNPRDHYTLGTKIWATAAAVLIPFELWAVWYDAKHPGNRGKWALSSNAYTWAGWDSVTGEPVDVPYGNLRRSAMVMFLAWLSWHWTAKRPVRRA